MKGARYRRPFEIKRGETFRIGFRFPDLASFGGPSAFGGAVEVTAQLRKAAPLPAHYDFEIDVTDTDLREVYLELAPEVTEEIPFMSGVWDLQVKDTNTGWVGTPIYGDALIPFEVTRAAV